jgi:urease accessory protein
MRIIKKHATAQMIASAPLPDAPKAILPFELRRRSRQRITLSNGEEIGLLLSRGTVLRHGDLLIADDGQCIPVEAAPEQILRVTAQSPQQLTRAAYHLGNRHIPVEIGSGYLQLGHDPVLVDMLERLEGVSVVSVEHPFEPESGAYGGGHKHGHDETFDEDYALAQAVYATRDPAGTQAHHHAHKHDHGNGQQHGDDHGHDH